jgi:hypothetical protein
MPNSKAFINKILESDISPKTKTNYESGFRTLAAKAEHSIEHILLHPDTYIPLIRKWFPKDTSYKVHLSFILGIFKYNKPLQVDHQAEHEKWVAAFKASDAAVKERYETNEPTERQQEGYVPYVKIIKAREDQPKGSITRVLLGMYTYLPPRRLEYSRMALYKSTVPEDPEPNYIVLRTGRMVIADYKTHKHHGAYEVTLSKALMEDINGTLVHTPRDWLFINTKGEPYSRPQYSAWTMSVFKKLFGKPLTVALIRHSFINSLDFNSMTVKDKKDVALAMSHTVEMQDVYRLIF